jgi:hypothetical protein
MLPADEVILAAGRAQGDFHPRYSGYKKRSKGVGDIFIQLSSILEANISPGLICVKQPCLPPEMLLPRVPFRSWNYPTEALHP